MDHSCIHKMPDISCEVIGHADTTLHLAKTETQGNGFVDDNECMLMHAMCTASDGFGDHLQILD